VKDDAQFCSEHNRWKEIFCRKCPEPHIAMCPICVCKHQNEKHEENTVHITTVIEDTLRQVKELMREGVTHQKVIAQENTEAERLIREKETIRLQLDQRLEGLMQFYTAQKAIVAENNAAMLNSYERIVKESQKVEFKINDNLNNPDKVANRVKEMIDDQHYWPALAEAKRALVEDVVFDDAPIREELGKSQEYLKKYQDQLATLDITPLHSSKYNKLLQDKADLQQLTEQLQAEIKVMIETHAKEIRTLVR